MKINWKIGVIAVCAIVGVVLIGVGVYRGFVKEDDKPKEESKKELKMINNYAMSLTVFANDIEVDYEGSYQEATKQYTLTNLADEKTYSLGNPYQKVMEALDQKESLALDELKVDISMDRFLEKNPDYQELLPIKGNISCTYTIYEHKIESIECENSDAYFAFSFEEITEDENT